MADHPTLSPYALCEIEDVADLLGYDDDQMAQRSRTIIRAINSASVAIPRRAQRQFVITEAEEDATKFFRIETADVRRGYLRSGDMSEVPSEIKLWTPARDSSFDLDPVDDIIMLPSDPEPGFPWESIEIKPTASTQLAAGYWLSIKTTWGFPYPPDDIVQIAIGTAASQILNDVMQLTELARQQGRRVRMESIIPVEYIEEVDSFRIYRVA